VSLYHPEEVEDPLLADYREDVVSTLLLRGEPHALDEDDQLVVAAHFDRGLMVAVCAAAVRSSRRSRPQETTTDHNNHGS